MERKLKINLSEINPHVRYVQHLKHPSDKGEEYYVPWRIIYDFEIMFIVSGHFRLRLPDGALDLTGGDLIVNYTEEKILLKGNANLVYYGEIKI